MQVVYRPSFLRRYRKLPPQRRHAAQHAVAKLLDVISTKRIPEGGLGMKQLQGEVWEIRSDIRDRIVFLFGREAIEFLFVGNHDDIRRFLKPR